ncbi:MAG: hypothetical protein Tsb002_10480 [Wenzhouxiangellaceae bacterium]
MLHRQTHGSGDAWAANDIAVQVLDQGGGAENTVNRQASQSLQISRV